MPRKRRKILINKKRKPNRQQGSGIRCPKCNGRTKVYHSVPHPENNEQHRYRKCDICKLKIYTIEFVSRSVSE